MLGCGIANRNLYIRWSSHKIRRWHTIRRSVLSKGCLRSGSKPHLGDVSPHTDSISITFLGSGVGATAYSRTTLPREPKASIYICVCLCERTTKSTKTMKMWTLNYISIYRYVSYTEHSLIIYSLKILSEKISVLQNNRIREIEVVNFILIYKNIVMRFFSFKLNSYRDNEEKSRISFT